MSAQPIPAAGATPPFTGTTVEQGVAQLIGAKPDQIRALGKTAMGFRVEIEGVQMGLKMPMPAIENALLRVGRHVWKVSWINEKDFTSQQLTVVGT